jgi:hypothetical protein
MTILTEPRVRQTFLEEIEAPLGDTLGVAAHEALLYSPTWSYVRNVELDEAEHGARAALLSPGAEWRDGALRLPPSSPMLPADDARARVAEAELDLKIPDVGIREGALEVLMQRKSDERRRRDILARGPAGVLPTAARFGVALGASAFDPLNVASAFVPVVSQARYAAMLGQAGSRVGRAAVRARVGAIEGTAGAALVEPIVLSAAHQEQADYDLTDSLLNIALGTALGGGLHVGFGAAADALKAGRAWQEARATEELPRLLEDVQPEIREAALRTSVAQAVTGRQIDVEPILALDHASRLERAQAQGFTAKAFHGTAADFAEFDARFMGSRTELRADDAEPGKGSEQAFFFTQDPQLANRYAEQPRTTEVSAEEMREVDKAGWGGGEMRAGGYNPAAAERAKQLVIERHFISGGRVFPVLLRTQDFKPLNLRGYKWQTDEGARLAREIRKARKEGHRGLVIEGMEDATGHTSRQYAVFHTEDIRSTFDAFSPRAATEGAAERSFDPENTRLADFDAARAADELVGGAERSEIDLAGEGLPEILEDATALARSLGDETIVARELAAFDGLIRTADDYGKAVKAAAACAARGA